MPFLSALLAVILKPTYEGIQQFGYQQVVRDLVFVDDAGPASAAEPVLRFDGRFLGALVALTVLPWLIVSLVRGLWTRLTGAPPVGPGLDQFVDVPPVPSTAPAPRSQTRSRSRGRPSSKSKTKSTNDSQPGKDSAPPASSPLSRIYGDSRTILCYEPATGQSLGEQPALSGDEMRASVEAARQAAADSGWAQSTFEQRRQVLRTLLELVVRRQHALVELSCRETGKGRVEAVLGEVLTTCEKIRWTIGNGERWLSPEYRSVGAMLHKRAWVEWQPRGVAGVIIPWNYPVHNVVSHVTSSLMSGNACVVKCSEWAAWSAPYLQQLCRDALTACGWPETLVTVAPGWADAGRALTATVDTLLFIGSTAVGKRVMASAADTLTPVTLELGGVDPFVVMDDAKLDHAVDNAVRAAFLNCGQNCIAACRIYVYDSVHDEFVSRVRRVMATMRQGPERHDSQSDEQAAASDQWHVGCADVGAMVMAGQAERFLDLLDDAVAQGAKVLEGGRPVDGPPGSQFFAPTLVVNCTQSMRLVQEEPFGPIMTVLRVPDDDDEAAVRMANDSQFGLSCSVYSGSQSRAVRVGRRILTGMTSVNDFGLMFFVQAMPFGGARLSGFGKFNGPEGLRSQCLQRMFVTDRIPGLVFAVPKPLQYPYAASVPRAVSQLVVLFYGRGWFNKLSALLSLLTGKSNKK